ncbi:MAG: DNA glycosylase [Candidatus ainarchaeum sp.]|nr:DNA glycosylase [Candidatus ainarchaeum sp.]
METDLRRTMESGQPPHFTWNCANGRYSRMVGGEKLELWQDSKGRLHFTEGFDEYVHGFLRLDDDLVEIYSQIATDDAMRAAIKSCRGLRVTKSDPWEALVCFVCSVNNNIPRIRKMVQSLMHEGEIMRPVEMLSEDLGKKRLGYREKYLGGCAEKAVDYDLGRIGAMDYGEARLALQEFPGVGPKVADCVLLFGYGFLEAFPVDVWVARQMKRLYCAKNAADARAIAGRKWGDYAGYAQQYLFHAARAGAGRCEA